MTDDTEAVTVTVTAVPRRTDVRSVSRRTGGGIADGGGRPAVVGPNAAGHKFCLQRPDDRGSL